VARGSKVNVRLGGNFPWLPLGIEVDTAMEKSVPRIREEIDGPLSLVEFTSSINSIFTLDISDDEEWLSAVSDVD
jgi:hypothetical protein